MYFISQYGEHDCAYTCLTMMLANLHRDRNYLFLPHDDKPYSYKEIISEAEKYNTVLLGVKITDIEELKNNKKFPLIVTLNSKNKSKHSVLVYKITKKFIYYFDPAVGKQKEIFDNFEEKWTKTAIIASELTKTSCPLRAADFIAKKDKITLPILQLLSGLSLLVGSYFISKDSFVFIPILGFSFCIIFELLFRQNLINAMKRMDELIGTYSLRIEKEKYFDFYRNVERYRSQAFMFFPNVIYSFLIIVFFSFVLVMNDKINLVYIGLTMILGFIESLIYRPYFQRKKKEIEEQEHKIMTAQNEYELNFFAKETRESSYKLGLYDTAVHYVSLAVIALFVILIMALSKVVSVTYVVFYICVSMFIKGEFNKIFNFASGNEDFDSLKNKVIQSLKVE